jgi:hypothetical protein
MAFTPEDGTGLADANAYVAVADVDTYFSERGVAAWAAATNDQKEAAIYRATDYIEARFGQRFMGIKLTTTQALAFPRDKLYDLEGTQIEGIPLPFKKAVFEYAYRALTGDLWNEPYRSPKGRIVVERTQVGPIEEDVRYAFNRDTSEIKPVPGADRFIMQYCYPTGIAVR